MEKTSTVHFLHLIIVSYENLFYVTAQSINLNWKNQIYLLVDR